MSSRHVEGRPGALASFSRTRSARVVAGTLAVGLVAGAVVAAGGSADAATTYSTKASGRFLSGTIAGLNLDSVAGIEGESAANKFGPTVTNSNSLKAELLNKAIEIPLQQGLQLPGLNVLQLGAVSQYAQATPTGKALGASGAVDSNGGIGVGGSSGAPTGTATLDLSGLGGAALSSLLNVKATIGAISARAKQAAGKNGAQTGEYNIASLRLELDLPVLANLLPTVLGPVTSLLNTVSTTLGASGVVTIPSLGDAISSLETISLPATGKGAGAIVVDLKTGTIVVDVEKLLQSLNLDINNLPPNTSLVPYIVKALAGLPDALGNLASDVVQKVEDVVGGISVAGLSASALKLLLDPLLSGLTGSTGILATLTGALTTVVGQLTPITDLLSQLLDIIVNGQSTSGGTFTETAVALKIADGLGLNSALSPIITALGSLLGGTLPTNITNAVTPKIKTTESNVKAAVKREQSGAKPAGATSSTPAAKAPAAVHTVKLISAVRPLAAAPSDPLIGLNLAQASVGPSTPRTVTPSSSTPTPTTSAPTTKVPTGVPAGKGVSGGSPELPLVLVLLTLVLAGGGVVTYRLRGGRSMH